MTTIGWTARMIAMGLLMSAAIGCRAPGGRAVGETAADSSIRPISAVRALAVGARDGLRIISPRLAPASRPLPVQASTPELVKVEGLTNAYRVSDGLIRGAAPDAQGLEQLQAAGVRTVVDLRLNLLLPREEAPAGVRYVAIPVRTGEIRDRDVACFLRVASSPEAQPVFLHCRHGADRTGVFTAAYRIVLEGWSKQAAIAEMTQGGFGFHPYWPEHVRYIERFNVEQMREAVWMPLYAAAEHAAQPGS